MEELMALKQYLLNGEIATAISLVEEMEEMSKDDKINNIANYGIILLIHLIKQRIEQCTMKSWDASIFNTVRQINRKNKRRKAGGYYLTDAELRSTLSEVFDDALVQAALELANGMYDAHQLAQMLDTEAVIEQAMHLITSSR